MTAFISWLTITFGHSEPELDLGRASSQARKVNCY